MKKPIVTVYGTSPDVAHMHERDGLNWGYDLICGTLCAATHLEKENRNGAA